MDNNDFLLQFPALKFEKRTAMLNSGDGAVYSLNWSMKELAMLHKHEKWLREYHPDLNIILRSDLPEKWDSYVKSLKFFMRKGYLDEIRRCTNLAKIEWSKSFPFDTVIREICLDPAIAYANVAFQLVADSVYDPNTNYWYRGDDKFLISHMLLYKFWVGQTGRGMVWYHSELDDLEHRLETFDTKFMRQSFFDIGKKFIEDIKVHEKIIDDDYTPLTADLPRFIDNTNLSGFVDQTTSPKVTPA